MSIPFILDTGNRIRLESTSRLISSSLTSPAQRRDAVEVEERVLLLEAVPRLLGGGVAGLELGHGRGARVRRERVAFRVVGVAQDQDVVAAAEGVLVDRARDDDDFRVVAGRLARRRAVVGPLREAVDALLHARGVERAALRARRAVGVDEDVLGLDLVAGQGGVLVEDGLVHGVLARLLAEGLGAHADGGAGRAGRGAERRGAAGEGEGDGEYAMDQAVLDKYAWSMAYL